MFPLEERPDRNPMRTLIVDDAPLMRKAIHQILDGSEGIEVVGMAANGRECLEKIRELQPDVITLDIDMPVMNGITTVKNIMVRHQIPIVIISSLVQDGYFAFEALRLGVMDFLPKPSRVQAGSWEGEQDLIRTRVRAASGMHVHRMRRVRVRRKSNGSPSSFKGGLPSVVVMGTTLAGPNTIMRTVTRLAPDFPGTIIALQEIHPRILTPFCAHFNTISPLEVVPVNGPCQLFPGRIYIGSTSTGLRIEKDSKGSGAPIVNVAQSPPAPIDELFASAARQFGPRTCGVLLTGIGTDGAEGMREIRREGGLTLAQEQDCCVYPNLVEHAIREDVVDVVMSSFCIADRLTTWTEGFLPNESHFISRKH